MSLASADCFPDFRHEVLEDLHGRDHHPIQLEKTAIPELGQPSLRFKTAKADWSKFRSYTENYQKLADTSENDYKIEHLTSFILKAAQESIPVSLGGRNERVPVPWWSDVCKKVHREKKRAQRTLKRNNSFEIKITF